MELCVFDIVFFDIGGEIVVIVERVCGVVFFEIEEKVVDEIEIIFGFDVFK